MQATSLLLFTLFFSNSLIAEIVTESVTETGDEAITVMSLNIYGWKTMPKHSDDYAQLIKDHNVDVLGIQEGVEDWQLKATDLNNKLPTDYQRAITLKESLGKCWRHKFQIFINHCQGNRFVESGRFDLTDGPNATRTGEFALIEKASNRYYVVNIHWEHESELARIANAKETEAQLNKLHKYPKVLLGDFNSQCDGKEARLLQSTTQVALMASAGIDCLFVKGLTGQGKVINASPSDHPAIVATLMIENSSL
jgi:endonuclease/exonuclease/phosphatase family metal-dependent hydrolase